MRLPRSPADAAILSTLLFPLLSAAAAGFDCTHLRKDGAGFDLHKLGGPRSIMHHWGNHNTTYTIDICKPLKKLKDGDVPAKDQCPNGTRVCAIERTNDTDTFIEAFPIAGELKGNGGKELNAKWERLKTSTSHDDSKKEGVRVELNGGFRQLESSKRYQKAIIEFICDKTRTGLEHLYDPEDEYTEKVKREESDKENDGVDENDPKSSSLEFFDYDQAGEVDILRLRWRTQYACEDSKDEQDAEKAGHWGFFTWFILIAFFSTATYLIFGSWLNYNRYGARGWDLLPHGDTIRDVPYLFKDWMRRVLNTIQGGGSRGGYAAV